MPLSSLLDSAVDSTQVLQHLWIILSFHHLCLICPSHRFPFQENLNVLDSVAVAICQGSPSSPCTGDLCSRNSNTDLEFSVCSLVLMISHHPFHLTVRILQHPKDHLCLLELSTLDPAWVQRTLLLQRREQLLLSTFDTYPTVTIGVDSVARVLQEEALPTPPSWCLLTTYGADHSVRLFFACNASSNHQVVPLLPAARLDWHVQAKEFI